MTDIEEPKATPEPIIATYMIQITIRGMGPAPFNAEIEQAVEAAVQGLGGVSRASRPLTLVKARATRTDD